VLAQLKKYVHIVHFVNIFVFMFLALYFMLLYTFMVNKHLHYFTLCLLLSRCTIDYSKVNLSPVL